MRVLNPGLLTSIQDLGRKGYQKYGIIVGGAMDSYALRIANLLVGNTEDEAGLEITCNGPTVLFDTDTLISICGGDLSPTIEGKQVPQWRPVFVKQGSILEYAKPVKGFRTYLAVAGGFDVPLVMGSRSTYLRAGFGGFHGRALKKEDVIHFRSPFAIGEKLKNRLVDVLRNQPFVAVDWFIDSGILPDYAPNPIIRVIRGGQFMSFSEKSRGDFFANKFIITPQSDRMGYRLSGSKLAMESVQEMISEAVSMGTVQVPPDGMPIVLMADRQTTGGYPKIAQVATVDLPLLAQSRPGDTIRFQEISIAEAQELYISREMDIQRTKLGIELKAKAHKTIC